MPKLKPNAQQQARVSMFEKWVTLAVNALTRRDGIVTASLRQKDQISVVTFRNLKSFSKFEPWLQNALAHNHSGIVLSLRTAEGSVYGVHIDPGGGLRPVTRKSLRDMGMTPEAGRYLDFSTAA